MKKTHTRVTALIQNDSVNLLCLSRLVEETNLESIERVFKTFGIEYEVDEIPSNTRLYSLTLSLSDRYISNEFLTQKELEKLLATYIVKKGIVEPVEFKKLMKGTVAEIHAKNADGEILIGYELTVKVGDAPSKFRFPSLKSLLRKAK